MEKHVSSLFQRIISMILCVVMMTTVLPAPVAAAQITDGVIETGGSAAENEGTITETEDTVLEESAPEWILPECDCGSTETELGKHGETCALKVFLEEFCDETAAEIFSKWDKLPEECQKYILEYLSRDEADAEKLAELNGYVNQVVAVFDDTEGNINVVESDTNEAEGNTNVVESDTNEAEGNTNVVESDTNETEDDTNEYELTEGAIFAINRNGESPLAVVYAASDFQNKNTSGGDDFNTGKTVMSTIIEKIRCDTVTGAMFLGDYTAVYTAEATSAGLGHVRDVLKTKWGLTDEQIIFVQGNHDAAVAGLDSFGGQEFEHYNVFVIPEDNFPWQQNTADKENIVKATAASLEAFLKDKVEKKDGRPVFVASHIPLHYTRRSTSSSKYDNLYAKYIFDVLNKYGEKLNIIFLFGHNHSSNYDNYIGGAAICLPVGSDILIPNTSQNGGYTANTLKFTYMNGGYIGYYKGACETQQSSTIFEIYEDKVLISRYDQNGQANLKDKGISVDGLPADESVLADAVIERKKFEIDLDYGNLATNQMALDSTGKLTVAGLYGVNYTVDWVSDNEDVVTVSPSADTMTATLTAHATGSAKITATITEVSKTRAVGDVTKLEYNVEVLETSASNVVTLLEADTYTYFQKVDTMEAGKTYALIDMEHDGYVVGQQMALQYNAIGDYTENDVVANLPNGESHPENEFNAAPVDVIQLPVGGELVTLAAISDTDCWYTTETSTNGLKIKTNRGGYLYVSENAGDDYRYDRDQDRIRRRSSDGSEWSYSAANGLLSTRIGTYSKYSLYYSQANTDFSVYRYDHNYYPEGTVKRQPEQVNSRAYAFLKTDIQIGRLTAQLSDTTGYVNKDVGYTNAAGKRLGGAQTGDMIVISDGTSTYEIPVTIDMLSGSFDVTDPGTYTGLTVTYAGKAICNNYVLVVRDSATVLKNDAAREYLDNLYTLTDTMIPGRQYLVVDTDEAGIAHAMGVSRSQVWAYNVLVQELPVGGKNRLYIDSSRYSWDTSSTTGADITRDDLVGRGIEQQSYKVSKEEAAACPPINQLQLANAGNKDDKRTEYMYATRLVWSPTQLLYYYTDSADTRYTAAEDDYYFVLSQMQTIGHNQQRILSIAENAKDTQLKLLSQPDASTWWHHWKYAASDGGMQLNKDQGVDHAYLYYNFQNAIKTDGTKYAEYKASAANQNFQTAPSGTSTYPHLKDVRRTWIYERVTDIDTVSARISDSSGSIVQRTEKSKATTSSAFTGDYILVDTTHADGTVTTSQVPITVSMLSGTLNLENAGTYENLTVVYQGVKVSENYSLTVREFVANDYPEFPDEGAVRIDKQLDTSKYNYKNTGAASIDLSLSGIPAQTGTDLVIMLDLSSSMRYCVHSVNADQTCSTCGKVDATNSRLAVMEETLEEMIRTIQQPINGYVPDVDIAIACFNGYTPINTDWQVVPNKYTLVDETKPDDSRILQPFVSIADLDPEVLNRKENEAEIRITAGTNYDRAMELAYDMMEAKQRQNALNNVSRNSIVVFMSDGAPYQYNYFCGSSNQQNWNKYLIGTLEKTEVDFAALGSVVENTFDLYYNTDSNKHWMAEAIKGDPNETYKVIDPDAMTENHITQVRGLGAEMYSIGFGLSNDSQISVDAIVATMKRMATDEAHYIPVTENEHLQNAFSHIADEVRSAGDAAFTDQMGPEFDLITSNKITWTETVDGVATTKSITLDPAPSIVVKCYELYKRSEIGETLTFTITAEDGTTSTKTVKVTETMVGTRKPVDPHIIETVTFNDDGTAAYSTMDVDGDGKTGTDDNILENNGKVIHAATFWYNTDTTGAQTITVDGKEISLEKECFYWNVGDIPQDELLLSYSVYLTGSMEGKRPAGTYDTNTHAELNYTNYLDNDCELSVPTPKLPWEQATMAYAFYLVDQYGNPIINQTTGETGSFERSVEITQPVYTDFLMNSDGAEAVGKIVAENVLPEGYVLYDPGAVYNVTLNSDGTGSYEVVKGEDVERATTYIQGLGPIDVNPVGEQSSDNYATANTIVWFAVYATVQAVPDAVVIDYGLPVNIDVLSNETMMGTSAKLAYIARADLDAIRNGYETAKAEDSALKLWEYLNSLEKTKNPIFTTTSVAGDFGTMALLDNGKSGEVCYTLNTSNGMQMNKEETFVYAVNYTGSVGTQGYYYSTVTVIPATTIYYEDSFVTFSVYDFDTDKKVTDFSDSSTHSNNQWTSISNADSKNQAQDRPGEYSFPEVDANNIYGYDGAYTNMTTYSLGSAMKVTVDNDAYATAEFDFWGTGFDIISLTSGDTGVIMAKVYDKTAYDAYLANPTTAKKPASLKSLMVDTYYGYKYVGGKWVVDSSSTDALYQVPVLKVELTDTNGNPMYGNYTAIITASYADFLDNRDPGDGTGTYDFYLDAIRIYDPANDGANSKVIKDAYVADGEGWPEYFELRNLIISKNDFDSLKDGTGKGIVFIDNTLDSNKNLTYTISDYTNFGPNNELYLAPGQAVAFDLAVNHTDLDQIHLAMKTVGGSGTSQVKVYDATKAAENVSAQNISTATDLYYNITSLNNKTVVIQNTSTSGAILSITNVKVTYTAEHQDGIENSFFTVNPNTGADALYSLMRRPDDVPEEEIPETTVPETTVPEPSKPKDPSNPFVDVEEEDFFYESVIWAAESGITAGYGAEDIFAPDRYCTRSQVVTFLWRAAGEPEPATKTNPFKDIKKTDYFYKAVLWAVEQDITKGYGTEDIFNPEGSCTRAQVATFLHRYYETPAAKNGKNPFTDITKNAFYYDAVLWAVEEGITNGYGSSSIFNPDGECTRGEIVTFLYRAMN